LGRANLGAFQTLESISKERSFAKQLAQIEVAIPGLLKFEFADEDSQPLQLVKKLSRTAKRKTGVASPLPKKVKKAKVIGSVKGGGGVADDDAEVDQDTLCEICKSGDDDDKSGEMLLCGDGSFLCILTARLALGFGFGFGFGVGFGFGFGFLVFGFGFSFWFYFFWFLVLGFWFFTFLLFAFWFLLFAFAFLVFGFWFRLFVFGVGSVLRSLSLSLSLTHTHTRTHTHAHTHTRARARARTHTSHPCIAVVPLLLSSQDSPKGAIVVFTRLWLRQGG
jgi:hypothetical protein